MKHLHETFTDQEWQELQESKKVTKLNWHDFLLYRILDTRPVLLGDIFCPKCKSVITVNYEHISKMIEEFTKEEVKTK